MSEPVIDVEALRFRWPRSAADTLLIDRLQLARGESMFLHGPSGCGKSTLLSLLAGVLTADAGSVRLMGRDWRTIGVLQRDRWRADHVGYIFQQFNLLPYLGVLDNVLAPCHFSAARAAAAVQRDGALRAGAGRWLQAMGLPAELHHRAANDLSVGQQQRVAAARALVGAPALIIADEPTSALDEARRASFIDLLLAACREAGSSLVFVSHDLRAAERFDRTLALPTLNRAAPTLAEA